MIPNKANDLKSYLPSILDRRENQSNHNYDYVEPQAYRSRLGYRKQMESAGISRALGYNRGYDGVVDAIRVARELSKENLPIMSNQHNS